MVQRVSTVAFEGIEARAVDVQVQVAPGLPAFKLVGCQCQAPATDDHPLEALGSRKPEHANRTTYPDKIVSASNGFGARGRGNCGAFEPPVFRRFWNVCPLQRPQKSAISACGRFDFSAYSTFPAA